MKVIVTKEHLASALNKALSAVNTRIVIPIMANVLLQAEGDKLTITSTDAEISVITWVPALVEEEGCTTLPARKFESIVKALPSGDITIDTNQEDLSSIKCLKTNYKLHGVSAVDFPPVNPLETEWSFKMKARDFVQSLNKVAYAKSTDDNRKQLTGVVMSIRSGILTMAATDGRRLALIENTLDDESAKDGDYILPSRASSELPRCIDNGSEDLTINMNKFGASFQVGNVLIITKLVDGVYPNFRQVIPENCGNRVMVQRASFIEALSRVALIVNDKGESVKLTFTPGQLAISAYSQETGEANESVEIGYEGEETSVSFNPVFITNPLKVMESDMVNIEFGKQYTPVKFTGDEGFLYMLMPMRN